MLLTREEQIDTLYAAAQANGVDVAKDDIAWRDGTFTSGPLTLHYLDWGVDGKPPLLLLHGGMQTAHSWDLISVAMKRDFHVVALDLRGHGDSDWSEEGEYAFEVHVGDIEALLAHLGWERLSLVGLSLGGIASMHWAAERWQRLDKLVIVDVGPELNSTGVGKLIDFGRGSGELDSLEDYVEKSAAYNPRRSREQLRYSLTHSVKPLPNGKWTWKYDRRVAGAGQPKPEAEQVSAPFTPLWDQLPKIKCPTLVVRGGESNVFKEETGRKMVEVLPNGRFVTVPDAGHTVAGDNPAGFLDAIRPFLA